MMDADLINRERFQSFGRIPGFFFFFRKDVRNEKGRKKEQNKQREREREEREIERES